MPVFNGQRHGFGAGGDVERDQKIGDQLDLDGGAELAEIGAGIGKAFDHFGGRRAGLGVAGDIDRRFTLGHHAGGARNLAVDEDGAFAGKRHALALFHVERIGAELEHDLARPHAVNESVRPGHDLVERLRGGQAGDDEIAVGGDFGGGGFGNAASGLEIRHGAAAIARHARAAFEQENGDRHRHPAKPDHADTC